MVVPSVDPDVFVEIWPGAGAPEISILMPIYQQPRYVREAIFSILAQHGVATEIIISDDGSSDETFPLAWQAVQEWLTARGSQHRIVMRRGSERLWRDHLPLLVDTARCDLVCQAHGDDISHPDRARVLVAVFKARPKSALLASEAQIVDANGQLVEKPRPAERELKLMPVGFDEIISCQARFLIGFSQAWRRSAMVSFTRLDRDYAAVSHDRILPFRAALAGEVFMLRPPLIKRRVHDAAATALMFDEPDTQGQFGWSLSKLTALDAMKRDLARARALQMVDEEQSLNLSRKIAGLITERTTSLLGAHRFQTKANRQIAWVDDETLRQVRGKRLAAQTRRSCNPHVFIISWTGKHANSLAITRAIQSRVGKLTIVYSDRDASLVPNFPGDAIRTPDEWYWGKKFKTCLDACQSDLMLIIHGDATCADWAALIERCKAAFAETERIGVWAPQINYTPFPLSKTRLEKVASTSASIVAQTDGIVFALSADVMARLRALNYDHNKYGWGIGWAALAYTYANKLIAVVDESIQVLHPRERGYDDRAARHQMEDFLGQLTLEERLQFRLLDSYVRSAAVRTPSASPS